MQVHEKTKYQTLTVAHLLGVGELMGLTLDPNGVIAKEVVKLLNAVKSNARHYWPKTGKSNYNVKLTLPDRGHAINRLVVCKSRDLEPLDLLNGLDLGCYEPSSKV